MQYTVFPFLFALSSAITTFSGVPNQPIFLFYFVSFIPRSLPSPDYKTLSTPPSHHFIPSFRDLFKIEVAVMNGY